MKRRTFLKTTPVIFLSPLVLSACSGDYLQPGIGKKVVVVGAGLAGIYAGHLLLQKGFEVEILEASEQWGGRIRNLEGFADFAVELGAEEVHGEKSEWYKLVKKTPGLSFADVEDQDFYWLDNGLKTEAQIKADADGTKALNFVENAAVYSGADKTVLQHLDNQNIAQRVRHFVNAQIGNEYGTSNDRLSIQGIAEENDLWNAGEQNFLVANRTFKQVMETHFSDAIAKTVLNTPVQSIDYSGSKVHVMNSIGTMHEADYVVVTVPLPVLRDGDIVFSPALPNDKTAAMQKIGMGSGMKIILKFSDRFWAMDTGSIYGAGSVPEYWHTSNGRGSTPLLTAFVMGEKAEQLSALGNAAVQSVLADLDSMYVGAATGKFVDAYIMDWSKMPFVRGAYSFPVVGGGIVQRQKLAQSVSGKIFFAGEATHTEGHSGTAHGALDTAIRVVKEIVG